MALQDTGLDFSAEDWGKPAEFFEGCWVIAEKHCPGLNEAIELNNRNFVFKLRDKQEREQLLVFGVGGPTTIDAVKALEKDTGLTVQWIVGNGGAHHLFLGLWYEAFPEARVLVPAKRVPFTQNGKNLQEKYADRWELMDGPNPEQLSEQFGDQIDVVIFDQLFSYKDEASVAAGTAMDHASPRTKVGGFSLMKVMGGLMKDTSQPTDEVFLLHRKAKLAIAGHNFQIAYVPKGHKPADKFKLKSGGFPMNLMMRFMMPKGSFKSSLEMAPQPIADSKVHAATWNQVLDWDFDAWTSCHDPPAVCGPDLSGADIKTAIRESLARSGEDDPTGERLKWNIKHR